MVRWNADGLPFEYRKLWFIGPHFNNMITPHVGSIVAISIRLTGAVVFEISVQAEGSDSILHGKFIAPVLAGMRGWSWTSVRAPG